MENGAGLIVYSYNMNDGSMFADLEGYLEEGYWREHPVIQCDTQRREYEVLACAAPEEQQADSGRLLHRAAGRDKLCRAMGRTGASAVHL